MIDVPDVPRLRLFVHSTLLTVLAFNLVFFVQELSLVFPKALPQVVIGAFVPLNDVGRAMTWLGMSGHAKPIAAAVAVLAMILVGRALAPLFLGSHRRGKRAGRSSSPPPSPHSSRSR